MSFSQTLTRPLAISVRTDRAAGLMLLYQDRHWIRETLHDRQVALSAPRPRAVPVPLPSSACEALPQVDWSDAYRMTLRPGAPGGPRSLAPTGVRHCQAQPAAPFADRGRPRVATPDGCDPRAGRPVPGAATNLGRGPGRHGRPPPGLRRPEVIVGAPEVVEGPDASRPTRAPGVLRPERLVTVRSHSGRADPLRPIQTLVGGRCPM